MRFGALKRNWEGLGKRDPLWAVLTDPDKRGGGWNVDEFFQTGVDEIAAVLRRAATLGVTIRRGRALDFGCGVGRLTQALGDHFDRCDGVDISASMLVEARRYDRHGGRCTYHLNERPDLALFPDGAFDFAYTVIVLQHMEPRYSTVYIRELVRLLAPGGVLVFQVPSRTLSNLETAAAAGAGAEARASRAQGPLPPGAFRARLRLERDAPVRTRPGGQVRVVVHVENASDRVWPARPHESGRFGINVANHWLDADGQVIDRDDVREPLPFDLAPGASAAVPLMVNAPDVHGDCWLECDLVQEDVAWFATRGSTPAHLACHVDGGARPVPPITAGAPPRPYAEAPPEPAGPPFRERHPAVFALLKATGLRDLYWAWRRAADRVKAGRDDLLMRVKPRIVNWWKRRRVGPHMEMHCVPKAEVERIVAASGARLVDAEPEETPGFLSYRYWVVKDGPGSTAG